MKYITYRNSDGQLDYAISDTSDITNVVYEPKQYWFIKGLKHFNCRYCGAPNQIDVCEYCGSTYEDSRGD